MASDLLPLDTPPPVWPVAEAYLVSVLGPLSSTATRLSSALNGTLPEKRVTVIAEYGWVIAVHQPGFPNPPGWPVTDENAQVGKPVSDPRRDFKGIC